MVFPEHPDDNTPLLIDLYATWCGPCKIVAPVFAQSAEDFDSSPIRFAKADIEELFDFMCHVVGKSGAKVGALPTLLLLGTDGKCIEQKQGRFTAAEVQELVERHI